MTIAEDTDGLGRRVSGSLAAVGDDGLAIPGQPLDAVTKRDPGPVDRRLGDELVEVVLSEINRVPNLPRVQCLSRQVLALLMVQEARVRGLALGWSPQPVVPCGGELA